VTSGLTEGLTEPGQQVARRPIQSKGAVHPPRFSSEIYIFSLTIPGNAFEEGRVEKGGYWVDLLLNSFGKLRWL
jgi:hypothetical protein